MIRNISIYTAIMASLSGCVTASSALTAAEIGLRIAKTVHEAKAKHPDDVNERLNLYADLYCDLRQDYGLEWDSIRQSALSKGAPEWAVDKVKSLIDDKCGE